MMGCLVCMGKFTRNLNQMLRVIRKEKRISFADLCIRLDMAPSTLHQYKRVILDSTSDIEYKGGIFYVK
jgi:hypothetical protein